MAAGRMVGRTFGDRMILLTVIALAIVMVMPIVWALGLSIKTNAELMVDTSSVLHAPYTLANYADIVAGSGVFRWLLNSTMGREALFGPPSVMSRAWPNN